jgi:hypothetical protein
MASRGRREGRGGGRIGGDGSRDHAVYRPVAETPAERRARIVRSEAARKRVMRKWANVGVTPPPKMAPYAAYATGESSSRRRPRSVRYVTEALIITVLLVNRSWTFRSCVDNNFF